MDKLENAKELWERATEEYSPQFTVCLVSGGNDSKTAYYVARDVGIRIDALLFVNTRTGIEETAQHVEKWAESTGLPLLVGDSGNAYEDYVMRKGFFGRGMDAHAYAYHIVKADALRRVCSSIRQRRRNFSIAMITGIRLDESDNRKYNFSSRQISQDGKSKNVFVNLIDDFNGRDVLDCISEHRAMRNLVADLLHRSAECMCGTTQNDDDRKEAAYWFPRWGEWLTRLERRVMELWPWGWGQSRPAYFKELEAGQLGMGDEYLPMCQTCIARRQGK